jgi:peptidoglycan hydrolase-like protein with peptidoglycan-binding domain
MKKLLTGLLVVAFVIGPGLASAETSSVDALLAQLKVLQERIAALTAAETSVQTAKTDVLASLKLIRGLRQGMSGDDVAALQALLASDPDTYPEGLVTGFYGGLTANAVKNFQKKHGIEAVGFVGPKTLQKLNEESETLGLSEVEDSGQGIGVSKRLCAKVPPGHLIAPGWLRKNGGVAPIVPLCQTLPGGIIGKTGSSTPGKKATSTEKVLISNLRANNVGTSTAVINWNTNLSSDSKVWYSSSSPWMLASSTLVSSGSLVTTHSLNLTGLSTSTTYYYVAVSSNGTSTATTSPKSFETDED